MHSRSGVQSRRGGALVKLLIFLVFFAAVLAVAWVLALPPLLTGALSKRTGFPVKVERLVLNPFSCEVEVEGLSIENPHTFPRPDYVRVRHFAATAHLLSLFGDTPDFERVSIDVEQIVFVRNTDGTVNATLFYDRLFPAEKAAADREASERVARKTGIRPSPKPSGKAELQGPPQKQDVLIRRLELKLDRVLVVDHFGRTPSTREFNFQLDQVFTDVKDARQLVTTKTIRAMAPAALALSALIPGELGRVLSDASGSISPRERIKKATDSIRTLVDTLEESRKP